MISQKELSLENVETSLRMHNDRREFVVDAFISSKKMLDHDNLMNIIKDISSMKEELGLDLLDIRVQAGSKGKQ